MNILEMQQLLDAHSNATLQFILPSGDAVPPHFHITEVGRIDKSFIDCGGQQRKHASCLLQLWTSYDTDHRLVGKKLTKILSLAESLLLSKEIPIEIEYGTEVASNYTIDHSIFAFDTIQFFLKGKKTDCLAKDKCGLNVLNNDSCC